MLHTVCPIIRNAQDPIVVDLGYGATPVTTQEMFLRFRKHVRPDVEVVGIEIDPIRVKQAAGMSEPGLDFQYGGFEIPLNNSRKPIAIRALNVLRQYGEDEVSKSWQVMTNRLAADGFLVEGTCDEIGRRSSWVAIRSQMSVPETFTISLHVGSLEKPSDIAPRLPKALIHRNVPGEKIYNFLQEFDKAWLGNSALIPFGARQRWVATVEALCSSYPILDNKIRWRLGEVSIPWEFVSPK
jgi:hypothetical protein